MILSSGTRAQTLIEEKIPSAYLKDSVAAKIFLPPGYSESERYPVVYEFIYDHSNYIAATAANIFDIPKIITVWVKIEGGNEHYSSPELSDVGKNYYAFVANELIPFISGRYRTANFNIAAGLSQGADYINYILRNNPSLFQAYLNFSIEYPIHYKPDFSAYTKKITDSLDYFIAIANDEKKRISFANQLSDSIAASPYVTLKKEYCEKATHSYSILYALPEALLFTFRNYNKVRKKLSGETLASYYATTLNDKKNKFGNISFHSLLYEMMNAISFKEIDTADISSFIDSVYASGESMDIDLVNIGYSLRTKQIYTLAEKSYQRALQKKQMTGKTAMTELAVYFQLFRTLDQQGKSREAAKVLEDGYEKTKEKDEGLLYTLGYYYIDKKLDIQKGIATLLSLLNDKHTISPTYVKSADEVYTKIVAGYVELKNKKQAAIFLNKALAVNPQNEAAQKLRADLK